MTLELSGSIQLGTDRPLTLTKAAELAGTEQPDWLADNVLHPLVNGSGLIQVYDTLANKPLDNLYKVPEAQTFSADWCVQSLASAGGAILPYVLAGKLTGVALRAGGEQLGLTGAAARFVTNDSLAQIAGAGIYSFAQKPLGEQTRLSSAASTMAGFAAFSAGNYFLDKSMPMLESAALRSTAQGAGRFTVGAFGGLGSYETGNLVADLQGYKHEETWDERLKSMAQGGFINAALPVVQEAASKALDAAYSNSSKGLPLDREIKNRNLSDSDLQALLEKNPLARVKRVEESSQPEAWIEKNSVKLGKTAAPSTLAHELMHLELARLAEPEFKNVTNLAASDPILGEQKYYQLRATMEATARTVESRVQARADGDPNSAVEVKPETLGSEIAVNGRTYSDIWKSEWIQIKDDPNFRPPVEYKGLRNIVESTKAYDKWMADLIKIVPEDLAKKHTDMAEDPFKFMRATYYRWAETFPEMCPELIKAPKVNAVGDLHIDNFGTWTDKLERLIWGINDFDEAYKLPYTNDLVRLLSSTKILMEQQHLKIGLKDAAETVLEGYKQSLKDGGQAFVKGENNRKLFQIVKDQLPDDLHFWKKMDKQLGRLPESKIPQEAISAMDSIIPDLDKNDDLERGQRQAGEGSLGRQRFLTLRKEPDAAELDNTDKSNGKNKGEGKDKPKAEDESAALHKHNFAAETKAILPSANDFVAGTDNARSHLKEIMQASVREQDPFVKVQGDWIVRSLAPDRAKVELEKLDSLDDEKRLLYSMGYETANIHLGTGKGAAKDILKDLSQRDDSWLVEAVKTMTKKVMDDHEDWQKANKKK